MYYMSGLNLYLDTADCALAGVYTLWRCPDFRGLLTCNAYSIWDQNKCPEYMEASILISEVQPGYGKPELGPRIAGVM